MNLTKKQSNQYNNNVDYFYNNNNYIGKVGYLYLNLNTIYIKFLEIQQEERGKSYLQHILDEYKDYNIILEAKEIMEKYNKLVNHYIKHGFTIKGKEHIYYDNDICYRKIKMIKNII